MQDYRAEIFSSSKAPEEGVVGSYADWKVTPLGGKRSSDKLQISLCEVLYQKSH